MKLRCYVCGEPLGNDFYLMSMQDETDRVFVVGIECFARATDVLMCLVTRTARPEG